MGSGSYCSHEYYVLDSCTATITEAYVYVEIGGSHYDDDIAIAENCELEITGRNILTVTEVGRD